MRAVVAILGTDFEVEFSGRMCGEAVLVTVEGLRKNTHPKTVLFGESLACPPWLRDLIATDLEEDDDVRAEIAAGAQS